MLGQYFQTLPFDRSMSVGRGLQISLGRAPLCHSVTVSGRVFGIHDISFNNEAVARSPQDWLSTFGAIFGAIASGIALLLLGKRLREVTFRVPPIGEFTLHMPAGSQESLAKRLRISSQDWKSSILLIRIKLEEQLREMAAEAGLPERERLRGVGSLSRSLQTHRILNARLGRVIANLIPVINREVHASESCLSRDEFENTVKLGLGVVAEIEAAGPFVRKTDGGE